MQHALPDPPLVAGGSPPPLVVDCGTCAGRGHACGDCVIMVLLGGPPDGVRLEPDEERALGALADAGLVPPLRHQVQADPGCDQAEHGF